MIGADEALAIIQAQCRLLPQEMLPVTEALGRVLAQDLFSPVDLPPFDNTAMDGFALQCGGTVLPAGSVFAVAGEQAAGDGALAAHGPDVWEIMTGARLPDGLDAVIPVEQVTIMEQSAAGRPVRIRLEAEVQPGQHIRRAGEDIPRGALALESGTWLAPQHLMLLAGLGIAQVPVSVRPKVAVLCTGRELVDDPALPLQAGQIRNSNGPFLEARLRAGGAQVVARETVPDERDAFDAALARALDVGAQMVISTGAVSMGRYDFVPPALAALGATILFHKVAMRPGKPLLFARLAGGQLYFGLPGNPVSSAVGLRFFIEPALRRQLGLPEQKPWLLPLVREVRKKPGFRLYQKAVLRLSAGGQLGIELLQGQESFKTLPLAAANAWAALPEDAGILPAGILVAVYPLGHESSGMQGVLQQ